MSQYLFLFHVVVLRVTSFKFNIVWILAFSYPSISTKRSLSRVLNRQKWIRPWNPLKYIKYTVMFFMPCSTFFKKCVWLKQNILVDSTSFLGVFSYMSPWIYFDDFIIEQSLYWHHCYYTYIKISFSDTKCYFKSFNIQPIPASSVYQQTLF